MGREQNSRHLKEAAQRAGGGPGQDAFGPQGAALVLELQRLRRAFDSEIHDQQVSRETIEAHGQPLRAQIGRGRRRNDGGMKRVIRFCLEQLGLTSVPDERRVELSDEALKPGHHPNSAVAPDRPLSIDSVKQGSPAAHQPVALDSPPSKPSGTLVPTSDIRRLLQKGGAGLTAGVAFLLERNAPNPANETAHLSLKTHAGWSYQTELRTGLRVLLLAIILIGGWLGLVPLAGAVVVPGNLVVQSNVKTIQHPAGGVVEQIAVRNGMRVSAGDLLVRLDATQARSSLQVVSKQLDEFRARIARLNAERDGLSQPEFPASLTARPGDDSVRSVQASELSLFKARSAGRRSQKELLQHRISQLGEEMTGLDAQLSSKVKQLELINGELGGIKDLYDKRLVPLTRLTTLQRETARIEGERGQLISSLAETKSKVGEAELQIVRVDQDFRTDVVKELGEAQGKEAELVERGVAARDLLDRIDIRAPTSGLVHQLSAHTVGGVIRAGDAIMEIVPDNDELQIEARLQPHDIDQVRTGQKAFVRFSAFNQRVTPQLTGVVSYVSADTSRDQQTNAPYFTVRIALSEDERRRLAGSQLVPGMPAEVFMQTGSRTMMSYLLKPITEQFQRAFVER
ncbi:MAG: hypothetical protein JWQ94_952 [Tardiphaga sp.]|nr:hypothetical protein [Tardiphaga sp.]